MRHFDLKSLIPRRPRILWMVLGALLLVSILPIALYHQKVLQLSQAKIEDTEQVQQIEITRSMAGQITLFESTLRQQLISERQILSLTGLIDNVNDPAAVPKITRLLEYFVSGNSDVLYVTAVGTDAKGPKAMSEAATALDQDPFVGNALQRAFMSTQQLLEFHSDPLALDPGNRPAFVIAVPLEVNGHFAGMLAAVVSLDQVLDRLNEASAHDRLVFVVDHAGHIVAHPNTKAFFPGTDMSSLSPVVATIRDLPHDFRTTATMHFTLKENGRVIPMMGAYTTMPELNWAVISQRSMEKAREDAGVNELNKQALTVVILVSFVALILGYFFAVAISTPIRSLAESTRAISRGEFHERTPVRGAAEISELAETFNAMADDIEQYIDRLKQAARENRELFLGSIRMLAAAIDEKDPYTRGHSDRVAKYTQIVGRELGLSEADLDKLRISALLHDVGKIGVDDRVLKKPGALTPEEFEIMKQHPSKGANIMRPVAQLAEMLPGIELHHECVDGRGYPYGLAGDNIPLMARIISVCDTLDAITTNRPYQSAMELDFAVGRIRQLAGTRFDPAVVDALEAAFLSGRMRLSVPALVSV
jgi:putative nucleotidyltransferase with HDIG domain